MRAWIRAWLTPRAVANYYRLEACSYCDQARVAVALLVVFLARAGSNEVKGHKVFVARPGCRDHASGGRVAVAAKRLLLPETACTLTHKAGMTALVVSDAGLSGPLGSF